MLAQFIYWFSYDIKLRNKMNRSGRFPLKNITHFHRRQFFTLVTIPVDQGSTKPVTQITQQFLLH